MCGFCSSFIVSICTQLIGSPFKFLSILILWGNKFLFSFIQILTSGAVIPSTSKSNAFPRTWPDKYKRPLLVLLLKIPCTLLRNPRCEKVPPHFQELTVIFRPVFSLKIKRVSKISVDKNLNERWPYLLNVSLPTNSCIEK